ncbi:nuclease-related domain-containing protein [Nitrosopumilus sp. S6]
MDKLETRRRGNSYRNTSIILFVVAVVSFFGLAIHFLFFFLSIVLFILGAYFWSKQTTWNIGAEGEESVIRVLENLDSSFKVVNDIVLPGDRQNIDHVVIGSTGVFVIETKNYNGIIKCYDDDWYRDKVGRRGTVYDASIGNPSKQAKRNAVVLKNWFESKNIDVGYIIAVVVFTNDDLELKLVRPTVRVVRLDDLLGVFNGQPNTKMTSEKINSIYETLNQLK